MHAVSNLVTAPMAGPTICCSWYVIRLNSLDDFKKLTRRDRDLNTVLTSGYIGAFQQYLKYIT